jgi:hypothetical protein
MRIATINQQHHDHSNGKNQMTNNPLIQKYEELYGKKEEPKEEPKKVVYELPAEIKNLSITPAHKFNQPFERFSGDNEFLIVADKIQKGEAKVVSTSINNEHFSKSITFEVQVYT